MINTLSVLIYLKTEKLNRKGKAPIYCRLTVDKKRASFSIKRVVYPDRWCTVGEIVKGNNDEAKSINSYINLLKKKIYDAHYKLVDNNTPFSADTLKSIVLNKEKLNAKSVIAVFEHHNKKVKALIGTTYAEGTYDRYVTALKHLKEFVACRYKRNDIYLHEISHEFITEFDFFLRSERKCGNNTTVKYIKNFGKILRFSFESGWIDKNPLVNFKMKLNKIDRGYLTSEELSRIHQKDFTITRLEQVRDVFLFQCFTGLAYCDLSKLTRENIFKDDNGVLWLRTRRTKTETLVNVPLLSVSLEILEKYKDYTNKKDKLLPVLSNQKMNSYLKEIADLCGIEKNLSSHLARHTFATTLTLANGVSMETVSKMLGHTNLNTTKIYARMLDTRVLDEMKILERKLNIKNE